ncbi:tRNA (adenosine(37)-N6)-threonylcarbamoyltransferase complex dimerization subunit type 1 TsaB [Asaia sp. As-1742]|uniref:tRNA (adenosine(37)-N6)-threonylcarbamoyltransferase complex dimerization subunit type 1 TsaB n=1 Tax=Asaia sp. As-1742 TaxID=2608325 RepID=UPI00141E70F9|nr:tRNA (adenosine(37)-N6)-threonylcarbamoyltransferase complex dimerization subunit type 1 TsaB [Asaia sp. As-1742]NIE80205.1 tRNA (adenosine(37)-N6)-threonylcarbamoyltransferase complex dimerization subunit type 1 TsaB [Asaia sp. As-1742]
MALTADTRSLVLNGATLGPSSAGDLAIFEGRRCVAHVAIEGLGATASLAARCRDFFSLPGWQQGPELIVAVLGPGSFTGLRASLALANGLASGFGAQLRGVTTGACFRTRPGLENAICLTQARRDRLFAEWADGSFWAGAPEAFLSGQSEGEDAPLVGSGVDMLARDVSPSAGPETSRPDIHMILEAGLLAANSAMLEPLYIDAPEAKLPARGLRPAPRG